MSEKEQENSVAEEKVQAFQKHLTENEISGFDFRDLDNDMHAYVFRSNLPIQGQNLPFMVLLDDSVYTIIQVQTASNIVTAEKKQEICCYLNDLNERYRMLKYHVDSTGSLFLTCCIPAGTPDFEPALIIAILNQIQGHLNDVYPEIMGKIWNRG
ncbi:MAG: YbjN domain-containing protein [Veillonellales bacterium]